MRKTIRYKTNKKGELIEISLKEFMLLYAVLTLFYDLNYYMNKYDEDNFEEHYYLQTEQGEILMMLEQTIMEEENE